jgi:hypothetical protein
MHIAIITAVRITAGYVLDIRGSISDRDMIFLFYTASRPAPGPTDITI